MVIWNLFCGFVVFLPYYPLTFLLTNIICSIQRQKIMLPHIYMKSWKCIRLSLCNTLKPEPLSVYDTGLGYTPIGWF